MVQDRTGPKTDRNRTGPRLFGPVLGPVHFQFRSSVRSGPGPVGPEPNRGPSWVRFYFFWGVWLTYHLCFRLPFFFIHFIRDLRPHSLSSFLFHSFVPLPPSLGLQRRAPALRCIGRRSGWQVLACCSLSILFGSRSELSLFTAALPSLSTRVWTLRYSLGFWFLSIFWFCWNFG